MKISENFPYGISTVYVKGLMEYMEKFVRFDSGFSFAWRFPDRLCRLVIRVPGYRSRGPGSIPSPTKFSEK
jgi:hypothetical protein